MARVRVKILNLSLKHIVGLKYRIIGAENIPDRPAVICAKHQSGWETLAASGHFSAAGLRCQTRVVQNPFFGWGLKLVKTIGIDRNNRREANEQLIKQGLARKNEGYWITIFPEGTRLAPGKRGKYKLGGARMAKMFEMDIVPVALNSGEFWPKNSFLKYPGNHRRHLSDHPARKRQRSRIDGKMRTSHRNATTAYFRRRPVCRQNAV